MFFTDQLAGDTHSTGGIRDINRLIVLIHWSNFYRRVGLGCGGATNHQRHSKALTLHLFAQCHHLIERGGNQTGEANNIHILFTGGGENFFRRDHHAQIDNLIVIALQHYANDILADIVDIAFYRGHKDLAIGAGGGVFFVFNIGLQIGHGLFHYPSGFHHLGQKHLA